MGFIRDLTGKTAVEAAEKAADTQVYYGGQASALLDPFKGIGQQGLEQAGFLTDPNQQYDWLQNNPLFQMGLDNANQSTLGMAAAQGRLSSGDTLQQLNNNALLTAAPLISDQKNSIGNLLNYGLTTAGNQGNLLTGQGAAAAGGIVGAANARGDGAQSIFNLGGSALAGSGLLTGVGSIGGAISGLFSDPALKENIEKIGTNNGFNIYSWTWNKAAESLGLKGSSNGVMADEVKKVRPDAVTVENGYMKVNYSAIGVL